MSDRKLIIYGSILVIFGLAIAGSTIPVDFLSSVLYIGGFLIAFSGLGFYVKFYRDVRTSQEGTVKETIEN
ncbi:MAG: hypothetical protein JSV04_12130 [Candidatus Heimdallarchaeota archaeon]|nr:MAG: hypothetical protein JSV04_12130 [Candidatus Heimdallarchaeota archaeon]